MMRRAVPVRIAAHRDPERVAVLRIAVVVARPFQGRGYTHTART